MKIVSWNLNGLLASLNGGAFAPIQLLQPDVLCLQEIRTQKEPSILSGYYHYWNHGHQEGHSGTAILTKQAPISVTGGFTGAFKDHEGRIQTAEFPKLYVVNVYVPNSQKNLNRHDYRMEWDAALLEYIRGLLSRKPVIICGDFNVARDETDIYPENMRQYWANLGYASDERSNFETLLEVGLTDAYRSLHPDTRCYTWWSNRKNKRQEDRGWRLDYFLVSDDLMRYVQKMEHLIDIQGSDHCPILLEFSHEEVASTDIQLADQWDRIDWDAAEKKLADLQRALTIAAFGRNQSAITSIQKSIVRDLDIKCLAVRHVCRSNSSPGIDKVRWKTSAEKMLAAKSLTSKNYHASPLRQIIIEAKNTGKQRRQGLPTYYDRAMGVLYGYSLIPVAEAMAERKSFAFRPGRSAQDAHAYVLQALKGKDAPEFIVCGDVKGFYSHVQHKWLIDHVPMDKRVLAEFLSAGIVFAGELFPAGDVGITEGGNISPYLGNFVLDGLQKVIYNTLHGNGTPNDFANGNLIRFADDILVTVRSKDDADKVLQCLTVFLDERGLILSGEKTKVCHVDDGFTFLSRTYVRKNGVIVSCPSAAAVERFVADVRKVILTSKKSQRDLIIQLNRKLTGWANYHRGSDAAVAFKQVDNAVQAALLEAAMKKHPRLPKPKVIARYWYKDADGRYYYALPDDKGIRVVWLQDTLLISYYGVKTKMNPFVDEEYLEARTHRREIQNVTGPYKAVWMRQGGRCHYCGRPILPDQPRTAVTLDPRYPPSPKNSAYVHTVCSVSEFEIISTMEDISVLRPYDVQQILEGITEHDPTKKKKPTITPDWKHYKFKQYLAANISASIILTFSQIGEIDGQPLPHTAFNFTSWWYPRKDYNSIAEAWLTEGYYLEKLDMRKHKITLRREEEGFAHWEIPEVLKDKLPDDAIKELENYSAYIIKKYGLRKR
ncbi:MAG: hypothetical protein ENTB_04234 [Enterocloster aldenensis]